MLELLSAFLEFHLGFLDVLNSFKCFQKFPPHILIYDNVPTHLKHPEGLLSVHHMPKFTPKEGHNWGIDITKHDKDGKTVSHSDRSIEKEKINMSDARFADGTPPLYFSKDHPHSGVFKAWWSI